MTWGTWIWSWVWIGWGVVAVGLWVWWELRLRVLEQRVMRLTQVMSQAGPNIARRIEMGGSQVLTHPSVRPWEDPGEVEDSMGSGLDLRP